VAVAALVDEHVRLPSGRSQTVFRGGEGPPLVFLHGGGGLMPDDPLVAGLARSRTVLAPLAPGFADLSDLDDLRDVHDLALHYDDLLEALGLDGVPVVGHSFGAMTAAELAAHVPRRVSALALMGSGTTSTRSPTCSPPCPPSCRACSSGTPRIRRRRRCSRARRASRTSRPSYPWCGG
jgi:pimeloyl-ACP methyl ester carboxylesterase